MDVFERLKQDDPSLTSIDERQFADDDFVVKLAWALCFNTQLRFIVFKSTSALERHRRNRLLVVALAVNNNRPSGSSWVSADDAEMTNLFCQLRLQATDPDVLMTAMRTLNEGVVNV